jgi:L-rhamnose mutarotase
MTLQPRRTNAFGYTICLRDEAAVAEYVKQHGEAWPEVVGLLQRSGFRNIRIFLIDLRLFMYIEPEPGVDVDGALAGLTADPVYQEWADLMESLQAPPSEADTPAVRWLPMKLVFDLGWWPA